MGPGLGITGLFNSNRSLNTFTYNSSEIFVSVCIKQNKLTRANPVHLQPAIVDLSDLLNEGLNGNVHCSVEQKLALIAAFNVKLDHDYYCDSLEKTVNQTV